MFVETKKEEEARVFVPSLADLIAWLEMQNPAQTYNFEDCNGRCLVACYMAARGVPLRPGDYADHDSPYMRACRAIFGGDGYNVGPAVSQPHTFGAALEHARALTPT